jgi:hypothetical protein
MRRFLIDHVCAPNDRNGNPRRCYLVRHMPTGWILAAYDEGYDGYSATPDAIRRESAAGLCFNVSVKFYRDTLDALGSQDIRLVLATADQLDAQED